jgi:hypothetical protein
MKPLITALGQPKNAGANRDPRIAAPTQQTARKSPTAAPVLSKISTKSWRASGWNWPGEPADARASSPTPHGTTNMRRLDNRSVVRLLRSEVRRAGGQSSWARREHIDRTMLNRVLSGKKPPTEKIIRALKLCNVYALPDDGTR